MLGGLSEISVKMRWHGSPPPPHRARMQPTVPLSLLQLLVTGLTVQVAIGVLAVDRALHVPDLSNWAPLTSREIL